MGITNTQIVFFTVLFATFLTYLLKKQQLWLLRRRSWFTGCNWFTTHTHTHTLCSPSRQQMEVWDLLCGTADNSLAIEHHSVIFTHTHTHTHTHRCAHTRTHTHTHIFSDITIVRHPQTHSNTHTQNPTHTHTATYFGDWTSVSVLCAGVHSELPMSSSQPILSLKSMFLFTHLHEWCKSSFHIKYFWISFLFHLK